MITHLSFSSECNLINFLSVAIKSTTDTGSEAKNMWHHLSLKQPSVWPQLYQNALYPVRSLHSTIKYNWGQVLTLFWRRFFKHQHCVVLIFLQVQKSLDKLTVMILNPVIGDRVKKTQNFNLTAQCPCLFIDYKSPSPRPFSLKVVANDNEFQLSLWFLTHWFKPYLTRSLYRSNVAMTAVSAITIKECKSFKIGYIEYVQLQLTINR